MPEYRDMITLLLSVSFFLTSLHALFKKHYLLTVGLGFLMAIPAVRLHLISTDVAFICNSIGAFIVLYVINRNIDRPYRRRFDK